MMKVKKASKMTRKNRKNAKKASRMPEPQPPEVDISVVLNDDCILHIFELLSFHELSSVSRTCKRFGALAGYIYQRKFAKKEHSLSVVLPLDGGRISLLPESKHVKSFGRYIQHVSVYDETKQSKQKLPSFLQRFCSGEVKEMVFHGCCISYGFINKIKHILRTVEKLSFYGGIGEGNHYDAILTHCRKLKYLKIIDNNIATFPRRTHTTIEYFEFTMDISKVNDCVTFLRRNPNIKTVASHLFGMGKRDVIKRIAQNSRNIEHLFFDVGVFGQSLAMLCDAMLDLRFNVKHLEMKMTPCLGSLKDLNVLTSLTSLTGLHLIDPFNSVKCLKETRLEQLKVLQLGQAFFDVNDAYQIARNLPILEKLYLAHLKTRAFCTYTECIQAFVDCSKNLQMIACCGNYLRECAAGIALELSKRRKQLEGACELTIYVNKSASKRHVTLKGGGDMVKIKIVDSEWNKDRFITRNPMVDMSMVDFE